MADANVSQLEINGTTYDICDATARDSLSQYVLKSGDTMTGVLEVHNSTNTGSVKSDSFELVAEPTSNYGAIYFKSLSREAPFIRCYGAGDEEGYGDAVVIGNGGLTVLGSGESGLNLYNYYTGTLNYPIGNETLLLGSDSAIHFCIGWDADTGLRRTVLNSGGQFQHYMDDVDTTKANNDITTTLYRNYSVVDKNSRYMSYLETSAYANGNVGLACKVRNSYNGTQTTHGFSLAIDNNGNRTVSFEEPASWREALSLNTANYESTASSICTAASGVTFNSVGAIKWGRVCMIAISFKFTTDLSVPANGNITNRTVCTLKTKYLPSMSTGLWSIGDEAGAAWYNTDSSGVITLGACEGTGAARTITAGTNFTIRATYICNNWN